MIVKIFNSQISLSSLPVFYFLSLSLNSISGLGRNIILTSVPAGTKLIAGNKPVSFVTAQQFQQLQQQGQATQVSGFLVSHPGLNMPFRNKSQMRFFRSASRPSRRSSCSSTWLQAPRSPFPQSSSQQHLHRNVRQTPHLQLSDLLLF